MPKGANIITIAKGARHQGEGPAGDAPRVHVVMRGGVILCGAVPRRLNKAADAYRRGYLNGQYQPACPACRRMLRQETP